MKTIKIPSGARKLLQLRSIPVRAGCCEKPFMYYAIANLFSGSGNGDGDDHLLCYIADEVIAKLEANGLDIDCLDTIHNSHCIDSVLWNGGKWENTFEDESSVNLDDDETYARLWNSLPEKMRRVLITLLMKGLSL